MAGIAYNRGDNAYVGVQVESSDYQTHHGWGDADLLTLFSDQIVETFAAAIGCTKNRYQYVQHFGLPPAVPKYRCYEFANSADWYQVGIHGLGGQVFPHMRVKIWLNGKTLEGQFDCKGTQTSVWGSLPNSRVQEYAQLMGFPLRSAVSCATKDGLVEGYPSGECNYDKNAQVRCTLEPKCQYK
jgi:hypothetical protein